MKAIVDRFEGEFAVLEVEDGFRDVPAADLPDGVREGSSLVFECGAWRVDDEEGKARHDRIAGKMSSLFKE